MPDPKQFSDHFGSVSSSYAKFRPSYPAALFDWLASIVPAHDVVWDCACGSGQASLDLAARFERVIATDASAAQVESAPPHPRVDYRVAAAEHSGLPDASVDCATVAQALHWFDIDAFFVEVRRVVKRGGVLATWTYGVPRLEDANADGLVQTFYFASWSATARYVAAQGKNPVREFAEELAPAWGDPERAVTVTWPLTCRAGRV